MRVRGQRGFSGEEEARAYWSTMLGDGDGCSVGLERGSLLATLAALDEGDGDDEH